MLTVDDLDRVLLAIVSLEQQGRLHGPLRTPHNLLLIMSALPPTTEAEMVPKADLDKAIAGSIHNAGLVKLSDEIQALRNERDEWAAKAHASRTESDRETERADREGRRFANEIGAEAARVLARAERARDEAVAVASRRGFLLDAAEQRICELRAEIEYARDATNFIDVKTHLQAALDSTADIAGRWCKVPQSPLLDGLRRCTACGVLWSIWGPSVAQPHGSMSVHGASCAACEPAGPDSAVFERVELVAQHSAARAARPQER